MKMDNNDFAGLNPDDFPNFEQAALEEMARLLVPIFRAFMKEGLSAQEAAAMSAAMIAQNMPLPSPPPMED